MKYTGGKGPNVSSMCVFTMCVCVYIHGMCVCSRCACVFNETTYLLLTAMVEDIKAGQVFDLFTQKTELSQFRRDLFPTLGRGWSETAWCWV